MTTPVYDMTGILEDLAAGRIDAGEAARRIDLISSTHVADDAAAEQAREPSDADAWAVSTDRPQRAGHATDAFPDTSTPPDPEPTTEPTTEPTARRATPRPAGAVDRVSIRAVGRRVRIVGEPSIATVAADGPHVLRRNGSVMEISSDGEIGASIDGFQLLRGAPRTLEDFRALSLGKELFIRVNPNITVDVEVTAGSLHTERVPVLGKVRVTAGGAKLLDVEEIADALVQAGQATIRGTLREGRSRLRAESGSLVVQLGDRSEVTIHTEAQLGKVSWSGGHDGAGDEVVMGSGRARLDVEVVMGYAQVQAGSSATAGAK
ncbi:MAG: hypothetical protein ACR2LI_10870 [Propionibacteriaceae bacterium]